MRWTDSRQVRTARFAPLLPEEGWTRFADGVVGGDRVPKSLELVAIVKVE